MQQSKDQSVLSCGGHFNHPASINSAGTPTTMAASGGSMTQTQLLALDTILPTVLCIVGLVFLATAIWPIATPSRAYALRSVVFGLVGIVCVGLGVWLWLVVLQTASKLIVQELPPPGGTSSITTAQRPSP